ncbi:MAG: hypothetical protein AAF253_14005, partial [Pseudomonadota bacterium]
MVWLATHIWMLLAGAGVIGLLLGLGIRGLMLGGKARRALVERDVALTELDQARAEIEALYESQRQGRGTPAPDDGHLREELAAREAKVAALTDELFQTNKALETLKSSQASGGSGAGESAIAATAGAIAGAAAAALAGDETPPPLDAGIDADEASLEWRNRYLESRVRRLEQDLSDATRASAAAGTEAVPLPAEAADKAETGGPDIDPTDVAKLRWQNDYLQTRVKVLEEKVTAAAAVASGPLLDTAESAPDPEPQPEEPAPARSETTEEEVARLRWRNRYLEGRLAYLEEGAEGATSAETSGAATLAAGALAAGAAASASGRDAEPEPETDTVEAEIVEPEPAEPEATAGPDTAVEPEAAPEPEPEPEPELASEPEPEPEPETELAAEPELAPEPEPAPEQEPVEAEPADADTAAEAEPDDPSADPSEDTSEAEAEPTAESVAEAEPEPVTEPDPE